MSSYPVSHEVLPTEEQLLSIPEVSERLGVVVTKVMDLLNEHKLIAVQKDGVRYIPEIFLNAEEKKASPNKFVPGVIALLADGGYSDEEILSYLFSEDETLPGRPVDALHGHLAREVMRRAQAMGL